MNNTNKQQSDEIGTTLVGVTRVTKVVKGGRKFSFAACVVAGNSSGSVGYGHGKAKEVTEARVKATQAAKKSMIKVPLYKGRTIHHDVVGRSGAAKVILRKAKAGTGIIAGGPMRAVFESIGLHDIVAKSLGSSNVYAMIAATFDALRNLNSPKAIAARRGVKVTDLSTDKVNNTEVVEIKKESKAATAPPKDQEEAAKNAAVEKKAGEEKSEK
jgi:small subunit ribosomal protein S5